MLRSWTVENTQAIEPTDRNWRIFDTNSKTIVRTDLVFTSPTSDPVIDAGYFTLYGPLVFYVLKVTLDTNDGWTSNSYINMPYPVLNDNGVILANHTGLATMSGGTGLSLDICSFKTPANPTRLGFASNYTNPTGANLELSIQGWYYRN